MREITRILCPVDFADASAHAISRRVDGSVEVARALTVGGTVSTALRAFRSTFSVTRLSHARSHVEILRMAAGERADLIVTGVHGRSGLDLALFGSTANQVVRQATCPVITLRQ